MNVDSGASSAAESRRGSVHARRSLALLGLFLVMRIALDVWWLREFRAGYPLNVDEVGYLTLALNDTHAWKEGGLPALWREVSYQSRQAPLVPLLTVPVHLLLGERILASFLVQSGFLALLAVSSYAIAARFGGPHLGLLTAVVMSSIPEVIDWSRAYHFAVPCGALFTTAVFALLRSDGLRSLPWTMGWGVLLGLTALSRTMTIAFIPGMIVAAGSRVLAEREARLRRGIHLGAGVAAGVSTAAVWYLRSAPGVLDYLGSYAYGTYSRYYGGRRPWSLGAAIATFIDRGFHLPLACLVVLTLFIGIVVLVRKRQRGGAWSREHVWLRSDGFTLAVVFVCGFAALASSKTTGTGFALPLLPLPIALCAGALAQMPWASLRALLAAAFLAVSALNLVSKAGILPELSGRRWARLPGVGYVVVLEGTADIQRVLSYSGYFRGSGSQRIAEVHKRWIPLGLEVVEWMIRHAAAHGLQPIGVFASRDPFFNGNLLSFVSALQLKTKMYFGQLDAATDGDTVEAYRAYLEGGGPSRPNFLITTDPGRVVYPPPVTQSIAEEAGRSLGFERVATFALPDGRQTRIWWRNETPPATP